eukprot:scaffold1516_cov230-Pinguiococcus_pyrenoidosus.AAC.3
MAPAPDFRRTFLTFDVVLLAIWPWRSWPGASAAREPASAGETPRFSLSRAGTTSRARPFR